MGSPRAHTGTIGCTGLSYLMCIVMLSPSPSRVLATASGTGIPSPREGGGSHGSLELLCVSSEVDAGCLSVDVCCLSLRHLHQGVQDLTGWITGQQGLRGISMEKAGHFLMNLQVAVVQFAISPSHTLKGKG